MQPITHFSCLELDKENIMPIPQGRSAKTLNNLIHTDTEVLSKHIMLQRTEFENNLDPLKLQDLDDPLEPYLKYLKWIRETYKSGNTNESDLIQLLERTTHDFKDDLYYKNEIRYFKVWLEYISYSDHPGDVFNYLLKKQVGSALSLFYEKYSLFFELNDQWEHAEEILKLGISKKSRPLSRILKTYEEFIIRKNKKDESIKIPVKGLSNPDGTGLAIPTTNRRKQPKIQIFNEGEAAGKNNEERLSNFKDIIHGDLPKLDSIKNSKKENVIHPSEWKGETLKDSQNSKTDKKQQKIDVFLDKSQQYPISRTILHPEGKKYETYDFNFDLFMPKDPNTDVNSLLEVLLMFQPKKQIKKIANSGHHKRSLSNDSVTSAILHTPNTKKSKFNTSHTQDTPLVEYFKNTKDSLFTDNITFAQQRKALEDQYLDLLDDENKKTCQEIRNNNLLDDIISGAFSDIFTDNTVTKSVDIKTPSKTKSNNVSKPGSEEETLLSSPFVENPDDIGAAGGKGSNK